MFNVNSMNENACPVMPEPNAPCTTMYDNVKKLHEMISTARAMIFDVRCTLFGNDIVKMPNDNTDRSITCMSDDIDAMLADMYQIMNYLGDMRNRIG